MRPIWRRSKSKRPKQRGVAAVEFALSLVFFVPMVLGILDYGYYFWVAVTTVEAARVAARQVAGQVVTNCSNTTPVNAARTLVTGSTGAAKVYMNQIGMAAYTTVTATCGTSPLDPTWNIKVQVDFKPAVGFLRAGMHASTSVTGYVEYSQSLYVAGS
jgi:Flp pilus assembly protein TadG